MSSPRWDWTSSSYQAAALLAGALGVAALMLPIAYYFRDDWPFGPMLGNEVGAWPGLVVLLFGWTNLVNGSFAWCANILLVPLLYSLAKGRRPSLPLATCALILGASGFAPRSLSIELGLIENPFIAPLSDVTTYGSGAWTWLAMIVVVFFATLLGYALESPMAASANRSPERRQSIAAYFLMCLGGFVVATALVPPPLKPAECSSDLKRRIERALRTPQDSMIRRWEGPVYVGFEDTTDLALQEAILSQFRAVAAAAALVVERASADGNHPANVLIVFRPMRGKDRQQQTGKELRTGLPSSEYDSWSDEYYHTVENGESIDHWVRYGYGWTGGAFRWFIAIVDSSAPFESGDRISRTVPLKMNFYWPRLAMKMISGLDTRQLSNTADYEVRVRGFDYSVLTIGSHLTEISLSDRHLVSALYSPAIESGDSYVTASPKICAQLKSNAWRWF